MAFCGHKRHKMDPRGRCSFSVDFREELIRMDETRLVISRNFDGDEFRYLVVYPRKEWDKIAAILSQHSQFDPNVMAVKRHFFAYGEQCSLDNLGRILISPELKEFAALGETIIQRGMTNYVELWDELVWQQAEQKGRGENILRALSELTSTEPRSDAPDDKRDS